MSTLENIVNEHFENRSDITPASASQELKDTIEEVIAGIPLKRSSLDWIVAPCVLPKRKMVNGS